MALPDAAAIETAALKAWPGLEAEYDGKWVRRAAGGYSKRANSVQSLDVADDGDAERRIAAAADWLTSRNLRPVFRLTPLAGPGIHAALNTMGWTEVEPSLLMAMALAAVEPDPRVSLLSPTDPKFLDAQQVLQGYDAETRGKLTAVVQALRVPAVGLVLAEDGRPLASALMAVADGIVVTGNVITDQTRRREGLSSAVHTSGLAWAREGGATSAALNVLAANAGAIALYERLGYRRQYGYSYRLPSR